MEITAEVGAGDKVSYQGGCGCPDLGTDLLGGGPVSHVVWVVDVGDKTPTLGGCWEDSTTGWTAG